MPFAKPQKEESWLSECFTSVNGKPVLQQTSSLGASVAISGEIGIDGLQELREELQKSQREAEPILLMMLAMEEVLGVFHRSALAMREIENLETFVWLVNEPGMLTSLE
jgi:hypothetical protein